MNDKSSAEIFRLLNTPTHWRSKADKLKHCGDLLFASFLKARELIDEEQFASPDFNINDVATLLYGMAMENILKAALLNEGIAQIESNGRVVWHKDKAKRSVTGDHDILGIYRLFAFIKLAPYQEKLLERLSAFVHWAGRYPTPWSLKDERTNKDFKGFCIFGQPNAAYMMTPIAYAIEDKHMFDEIYKAIGDRISRSKRKSS